MPETQKIRDRILRYLGEKGISKTHLAMLIGENKQYVGEVLSGKKCGPKANSVLLVIVKALGIK
ncbi:hypothetical protein [Brochothrix thermosphacta]|uniref:hypothetical protein n=1 Tax=Brochothrix thermosphacta TaxID=2756 RepID=UPI0039AFCA9E